MTETAIAIEEKPVDIAEQLAPYATPLSLREKLGAMSPDELVRWMNMLIYGDPGAGKTNLTGTADDSEETSPLLIFDVEGGLMTIRNRSNVDVVSVRSIDDLVKNYADLHSSIDTETNTLPYKCVGVDSLTELQKLDMKEIMKVAPGVLKGTQDIEVPSQREWGISQDHIRSVVRKFRDLPCNVIFTAHTSMQVDNRNRQTFGPDLPGKLRNQVSGFLDIVGYLYTTTENDEIVRKVQFAKTDTVIAKDRTGRLGDVVLNPTIPLLWDKVKGELVT